jgi:sensor histidine kinase YesM
MRATKQAILPTKQLKLNDVGFRIVLIPFFGIAIPLITGMVNSTTFGHWQIKLSFLYTIGIAFIIWQGNRFLLFSLQSYFDWLNKPVKKIIALLAAVSFFTIPVSSLMLIGWYHLFGNGLINWTSVYTATLIVMICVVFITHVYETVFLVKQAESDKLRTEQLERSKVEAELEALKNQLDPHFIFNSLNTLSHLIDKDAGKAKLFNDNLADVYRYILQNKGRDLVLLSEEMEFMNGYFSLLKIRFEEAVQLNNTVHIDVYDQYLIPPISLQTLMENAIKHNDYSDLLPITINIEISDESLVVTNELRQKTLRKPSSKIGLHNLAERYKLITNQVIKIESDEHTFSVSLPLLKIN